MSQRISSRKHPVDPIAELEKRVIQAVESDSIDPDPADVRAALISYDYEDPPPLEAIAGWAAGQRRAVLRWAVRRSPSFVREPGVRTIAKPEQIVRWEVERRLPARDGAGGYTFPDRSTIYPVNTSPKTWAANWSDGSPVQTRGGQARLFASVVDAALALQWRDEGPHSMLTRTERSPQ